MLVRVLGAGSNTIMKGQNVSVLYWAVAMITTAPQRLRERSEEGATLEIVIWAALIAAAAVAVIAVLVGIINGWVAKIPK